MCIKYHLLHSIDFIQNSYFMVIIELINCWAKNTIKNQITNYEIEEELDVKLGRITNPLVKPVTKFSFRQYRW